MLKLEAMATKQQTKWFIWHYTKDDFHFKAFSINMKLKTYMCKRTAQNSIENNQLTKVEKNTITKAERNQNTKPSCENSALNCLDWSSNDEVYFVSDNQQIYKWNVITHDVVEVAKLPCDFIITDMHWLLIGVKSSGGGKDSDTLLMCSNDGRFIILNKSARIERSVSAHSSVITSGRWSPDGAGLLTAGEDGCIKIWSRSGMLRSTVLQSEEGITCARWSSNSNSIVFSQGNCISVKPLAANCKLTKWRAHEGMVLSLSWSHRSHLIASGGEDFRFKIWNDQGLNLYTSSIEENAITLVSFNNEKDLLLVGTFNMLKLCSSTGWCYNTNRFNNPVVGSFLCSSWSADGTQVCCGTFDGQVIVGHLVEQQMLRNNLKVTTISKKSMRLDDIINGSSDVLDFTERIVNFNLGYGHLIVATSNVIHIYNDKYINTPIIIDGRSNTRLIEVGKKFFMVLDCTSIWIYTFTGRLHLNPKYPGFQAQMPLLDCHSVSLGLDTLVIRDGSDNSNLHIFNLMPGVVKQNQPFSLKMKNPIVLVAACRSGKSDDQFIAMVDENRELYITESTRLHNGNTEGNNIDKEIYKIGTQVSAIQWASESNILVGVHDICYTIWYCPGEGAGDSTIIALTTITLDATEFGKHIMIESFEDAIVTFRCSGAFIPVNINIHCDILHRYLRDDKWQQALNLCRSAQNSYLWAILAAVSTRKNQLQISEEAYSAALQIDKVSYLQHLKMLDPNSVEFLSRNSLLLGRVTDANTILLHNGKYREAVSLCLRFHNWQNALEIAQKYDKNLLDEILMQRQKYLKELDKDEWDPLFLQCEK